MVRAAIIAPSVLGRLELAARRHEIVDDHNVHRMDSSEFQSFATTGCGQNSIAEGFDEMPPSGFDEMPPSFQVCQIGPRKQRLPVPRHNPRDVVNSEQKIFSSEATLFVDSL
jgi:hypothetical protein